MSPLTLPGLPGGGFGPIGIPPLPALPGGGGLEPSPQLGSRYGISVLATEYPSFVEVYEALETGVGAGTYGTSAARGKVASADGGWTTWTGMAPNDRLRRRLKARHIKDGCTPSSFTSEVTVEPWTSQPMASLLQHINPDNGQIATTLIDQNARPISSDQRFRCRLKRSTTHSLTTTVSYNVEFDTESADIGGLHNNSSDKDRITIPAGGDTGFWIINGHIDIDPNGAPAGSTFELVLNWSAVGNMDFDWVVLGSVSAASTMLKVSALIPAPAVGDFLRLAVVGTFASGSPFIDTGFSFFEAFHLF